MTLWLISDTHFSHANILNFTDAAGARIRPEFDTVTQMNEAMIERWNSVVKPADHVYHLGDVTMLRGAARKQVEPLLRRLNGHKRLVMGNHDLNAAEWYLEFFEKVMAIRVLNNWVMTHIPVHPASLGRFTGNIHGHIHRSHVLTSLHHPDPRYVNVSVEVINYTPVPLESITAIRPDALAEGQKRS